MAQSVAAAARALEQLALSEVASSSDSSVLVDGLLLGSEKSCARGVERVVSVNWCKMIAGLPTRCTGARAHAHAVFLWLRIWHTFGCLRRMFLCTTWSRWSSPIVIRQHAERAMCGGRPAVHRQSCEVAIGRIARFADLAVCRRATRGFGASAAFGTNVALLKPLPYMLTAHSIHFARATLSRWPLYSIPDGWELLDMM